MSTHDELFSLSARYASAADRRDGDAYADVFTPDGELTSLVDGRSGRRPNRGREALAAIPGRLDVYHRTFHMLGQATYVVDPGGDTATGEVYCIAHHLQVADDDTRVDRVLYIRYLDAYRRDREGWRISERVVHVDWIEERQI